MSDLQTMLDKQGALMERLIEERGLVWPDESFYHPIRGKLMRADALWTLELLRSIQQEAAEAVEWLPWKFWKDYNRPIEWSEIDREFVDMLHFILQYFYMRGFGATAISSLYLDKNAENHARQDGTVEGREDYGVGA